MHRRQFMLSAGVLALATRTVCAQAGSSSIRAGVLINGGAGHPVIEAFRRDFAKLGYAEGQGFTLEARYAQGQLDRLPALASELALLGVDVILTLGGPASRAAKNATYTIPIVFSIVTDPVALGLVASMDRPGGNVTGITSLDPDQAARQLELIQNLFPKLARIGILSDATIPGADSSGLAPIDRANEIAARRLGLQPLIFKLRDGPSPDLPGALDALVKDGAEALLVLEVPVPFNHRKAVAEAAAARRLPTIFPGGQSDAGGLITFGTSVADTWSRMPVIADRIIKGAKPGELAVETVSRRELIVNLKAARALGFSLPGDIVRRADRVIE